MKNNLILDALLHVGSVLCVVPIACALVELTQTNVALSFLALTINAFALVKLHVWNVTTNY